MSKKFFRLFFPVVILFTCVIAFDSCKECDDENPRARIINNGTQKADVQVKTSGGNTVNINNVAPGTSSSYESYASGSVTFTVNAGNSSSVKTVDAVQCYDYDITIDSGNNISVNAFDRND